MKKLLVMVLLSSLSLMAYTQPFSLSAGLDVNLGGAPNFLEFKYENSGANATATFKSSIFLIDIGGFVDFTYGVVRLGYALTGGEAEDKSEITVNNVVNSDTAKTKYSYLTLGLYGKYPFIINPMFSVFPYVGLLWTPNLTYEDLTNNGKKSDLSSELQKDLDDLYLGGGLGVDIILMESLYIRLKGDYHYNLWSKPSPTVPNFTLSSHSGMKFGGSLAVGYKFF